jgi:hypothetical protein
MTANYKKTGLLDLPAELPLDIHEYLRIPVTQRLPVRNANVSYRSIGTSILMVCKSLRVEAIQLMHKKNHSQ